MLLHFLRMTALNLIATVFLGAQLCAMHQNDTQGLLGRAAPKSSSMPLGFDSSDAPDGDDYGEDEGDGSGTESEARDSKKHYDCTCNYAATADQKCLVTIEQGKAYRTALYTTMKEYIAFLNGGEKDLGNKKESLFIKTLVDTKRCIKCLTICLHEVLRHCNDERKAKAVVEKLLLYGALVNSVVLNEDSYDELTPVKIAQQKKFNSLTFMLLKALDQ
jgi:hypothetical protein